MSPETQTVFDVSDANFNALVVEASSEKLVLVDFWAPWCAPCRTLGPILEGVVASYQGKVVLAKVNVDENQALASQYGVQGIPAVKVFKDGAKVDEFTGVRPEVDIRRIIDTYVTSPADELFSKAQTLLDGKAYDLAEAQLRAILEEDTGYSKAKFALAKLALEQKQYDKAREYVSAIQLNEPEYDEVQGIVNQLDLIAGADSQDIETWKQKLATDENDLDARFALGCCYAAAEQYQPALDEFLTILKKDKKYKEGAAKDKMVQIFSIIGQRSPMADEYRDKLEWILY